MTSDDAPQKANIALGRPPISFKDISFDKNDGVLATITSPRRDESHIVRFSRDGRAQEITHDFNDHFDSKPKRSPDGDTLGFLSDRRIRGFRELYLHKRGAVEPELAVDVWGSQTDLAWQPGSKALVFLTGVHDNIAWELGLPHGQKPTADEQASIEHILEQSPQLRGEGRQLFVVDLDDRETPYWPIGPHSPIFEFGLVQDGAVTISSDIDDRERRRASLCTINFMNNESTVLYKPAGQMCGLQVDPSRTHFACLDGTSDEQDFFKGALVIGNINNGTAVRLDVGDNILFSSVSWRDAGSLVFTGWRRSEKIWGAVTRDGKLLWWQDGRDFVEQAFGTPQIIVSPSGATYAATRQNFHRFPELCVLSGPTEWRQISYMNTPFG